MVKAFTGGKGGGILMSGRRTLNESEAMIKQRADMDEKRVKEVREL